MNTLDTIRFFVMGNLKALQQIAREQTSPQELALFLATCLAVCLLGAIFLYGVVGSFVWLVAYRRQVSLSAVFLPPSASTAEYLGDLFLSALTTLALMLTFTAKENIIQSVKDYRLDECVRQLDPCRLQKAPAGASSSSSPSDEPCVCDLDSLFPSEEAPSSILEMQLTQYTLSSLLAPVVTAGQSSEAKLLVQSIVSWAKEDDSIKALVDGVTHGSELLLALCVVLLVGQVLWLVRKRFRWVRPRSTRIEATFYGGAARRLILLSISIALLLLAPNVVENKHTLADAVLASVGNEAEASATELARAIESSMEKQRRSFGGIKTIPDLTQKAALQQQRLNSQQAQITASKTNMALALSELRAVLDEAERRMGRRVDGAESQIGSLERLHVNDNARWNDAAELIRQDASRVAQMLDSLERRHRQDAAALGSAFTGADSALEARLHERLRQAVAAFQSVDGHIRDLGTLEARMQEFHRANRPPDTGVLIVRSALPDEHFDVVGVRSFRNQRQIPWGRILPTGRYTIVNHRGNQTISVDVLPGRVVEQYLQKPIR